MCQSSVRLCPLYDKGIPFVTGKETFVSSGEFSYITLVFATTTRRVKQADDENHNFELYARDLRNVCGLTFSRPRDGVTEHRLLPVRSHRAWMHEVGATRYFPFLYRDHVVVAAVFPISEYSYGVDIYSPDDLTVWGVERTPHIVLPR
jgi:hypothetical protein